MCIQIQGKFTLVYSKSHSFPKHGESGRVTALVWQQLGNNNNKKKGFSLWRNENNHHNVLKHLGRIRLF